MPLSHIFLLFNFLTNSFILISNIIISQNCTNSKSEPFPKTKLWKFWNAWKCCGNFEKMSSFIQNSSRGWRSASKPWICRNGGSPASTIVIFSSAWQGKIFYRVWQGPVISNTWPAWCFCAARVTLKNFFHYNK